MKKTFLFALILSLLSFSFYAQTSQIKVISPIEGKWLNKQLLLIDTSDGGDYFYSLNGSDPETMGFAYDGPVLIDLIGDITLRIKKAGRHSSETTVNFSVQPDSAFEASSLALAFGAAFFAGAFLAGAAFFSSGLTSLPFKY